MSSSALEHVTIFHDPAQFAGWPFAHGFWAFPDGELLVGFSRGPCAYERPYDVHHGVIAEVSEVVTLRSLDGGHSWPAESMQTMGSYRELQRAQFSGSAPASFPEPPDWTAPDFCMTCNTLDPPLNYSAPKVSYLQYSQDRGRNWEGPFVMPPLGFPHVQAKPDYVVRGDGVTLLFVTVARADSSPDAMLAGKFHPRFVAVYATTDRGQTWSYLSAILPSTPDSTFVERYYASPVQFPDGRILVALRCQRDGLNAWPEIFESDDGGRSWRFLSRVGDWGGPTDLRILRDGRVLAVYGYRTPPFGIRARVSEDEGRNWGTELILRQDGGSFDLGYPRVVELPDGRAMAAYYFNRADDAIQCNGGVRHIAGTIFTP